MSSTKRTPTAAPRLWAYLRGIQSALIMPREDWETLVTQEGRPVEIDISATPLAGILQTDQVVASFAQKLSRNRKRILIFREDQEDIPFSINLYRFQVFEDFRTREDYSQIVKNSDTDDDQAMRDFHSEYVIIIPEKETRGHHLLDIPGIYKATLASRRHPGAG